MGSPYIEAKYLSHFNFNEDGDSGQCSLYMTNGLLSSPKLEKLGSPILEVRHSPKSKNRQRRPNSGNRGNTDLNVRIYTDWANHYLEKARFKRFITDLQVDVCDGVLLADIIYSVTSETVPGVHSKPSNATQMVENLGCCLSFLANIGVNVDGLSARDIKDGNLKAILGLFFSLSRFKQQQKSGTTSTTTTPTNANNPQNHNKSSKSISTPTTPRSNTNGNHSNLAGIYSNRPGNTALADNLSTNGNPDMHSRLPSPHKGTPVKCPTVSHPSSKDKSRRGSESSVSSAAPSPQRSTNLNKLTKGHYSSLDRGRQQLTCPNNNLINSGSLGKASSKDRPSTADSSLPSRSGSPSPRGIPVRTSSRSLGPPQTQPSRSSPQPEKGSPRASSATPSLGNQRPATSSLPARPASATPTKTASNSKEKSMLDKFKLFKDKGDKSKSSSKKNVEPKSPTRTDPGAGAGLVPPGSPKAGTAAGKKKVGTTRNARKDPLPATPGSLPREQDVRRTSSGSSSIPSRTASTTSVSSTTSSRAGGDRKGARSADPRNSDPRAAEHQSRAEHQSLPSRSSGDRQATQSPTPTKKTSKLAGPGKTKSKLSPTSSLPSTPTGNHNGPSMQGPGTAIPKPGMASMGRTPKDKKSASKPRGPEMHNGEPKHPGMSPYFPPANQQQYHTENPYGSSRIQTPKRLPGVESKQSGSKKVYAAPDGTPDKMHDKNANIKHVASSGSSSSLARGSHNQKINSSKSSDRLHGSRSTDRLQYNLSPGPTGSSRSTSPNPAANKLSSRSSDPKPSDLGRPSKVDSDTQTAASVVHAEAVKQHHLQQRRQQGATSQVKHATTRSLPRPPHSGTHSPAHKNSAQGHPNSAQHSPAHQSPAHQSPAHQNSAQHSPAHQPQGSSHNTIPQQAVNMPKTHPVVQMGKSPLQPKYGPNMTSTPRRPITDKNTDCDDSNLSSTSNSNNSASSSNDSVIYRPSSCDELESGADSDWGPPSSVSSRHTDYSGTSSKPSTDYSKPPSDYGTATKAPSDYGTPPKPPPVDHIASLRQQKRESPGRGAGGRVETTFDADTDAQRSVPEPAPPSSHKERSADDQEPGLVDIKPMQPLMRSSPYAYMRNLPLLRPSLHIPTLSSQSAGLATSASSRLGVSRPLIDPTKLYTSRQRAMSHSLDSADYGSDLEGGDVQAGYMSDGDILRSSHPDDTNSGYLSEGGASLYAKRMQQRFREGIMAVKECMQKSSGMADDDSFDDSSSISSGDISDTINDISTDDNVTLSSVSGTSSERTNPYGSLKRPGVGGPGVGGPNLTSRSLPSRTAAHLLYPGYGRNLHGRDNLDNILGENWKKYCISEDGGQGPHTPEGKQYPAGIPGAMFIKKKSTQAVITDLRGRSLRNPAGGGVAVAVEDPDAQPGTKKDSETNTDRMMMRRPGAPAGRGGLPAGYGLHRPLSGSSNASNTSRNSSSRIQDAEALRGERLSNYNKSPSLAGRQDTDMGPEAYSASTLERKKRALVSSKTQTNISATSPDYQSSTLGRKHGHEPNLKDRMFGSRSSLNKVQQDGGGQMYNSTIISNPHATYGKDHARNNGGDLSPNTGHNYVNINYLSPDGHPPRPLSGLSSPGNGYVSSPGNGYASSPGNGYSWPKTGARATLSETESMESLSSAASSSIQAQIQQARASALASRNILQGLNATHMGLHRSDSFKSTKSEKVFPTSSQPSEALQRTSSFTQLPSSPTQRGGYPLSGLSGPSTPGGPPLGLSRPSSSASSSNYANVFLPLSKLGSASKDDELHGSALSLVSSSSSVYSTTEEKHQHDVRKLRRELEQAQEKVSTLTCQLTTNAHVVSAFEQSLSNMTHRLQDLSLSAEAKDSELAELRATIESLKKQSGIASLSHAAAFSPASVRRQSSSASCKDPITPGSDGSVKGLTRHRSSDSVSSLNSMSSACSATSHLSSMTQEDKDKKKAKKKNWLRSSFSKAFSRKAKGGKSGSMSDAELDSQSIQSDVSTPNSPLLHAPHAMSMPTTPVKSSNSSSMLADSLRGGVPSVSGDDPVLDLQQQLHEKDMKLTEIRLESLSSVHQLEQLRDTMNRMKSEMASLKADNDRLHRIVTNKGISPTSPHGESLEKRLSLGDPSSLDLLLTDSPDRDGRRITLSVFLSSTNDFCKLSEVKQSEVLIGAISVSGKTKWDILDTTVKRAFKEYILRIDPVTNLGLNGDSIASYSIGDIVRSKGTENPELLPCGYLVGESTNIAVTLKGAQHSSVDTLSFETLIPKSIIQRYVSLLMEHRRIILCGPSGTGKTVLAQKMAEYLVLRAGKQLTPGAIATFNVDHKSSKELRQYLANIADQCESWAAALGADGTAPRSDEAGGGELPNVIILDNLHHVASLGEVFNGFLSVKHQQCPYIIGTMNQTTGGCSTTNLQLHHNFRWVLCANHMEPVKGLLGRFLRRALVGAEVAVGARDQTLSAVLDWLPKVWQHLNKFLETHSSSDVTIGPRLFLTCPMEVAQAQVWFTDLWNYSIVPYMLEAVREGIQLYGKRSPWEDPAEWVMETYPWTNQGSSEWPALLHLRPEDVGYDTQGAPTSGSKTTPATQQSDVEGDPLMNMLLRLQEAASYSSPQSNDSDSTSLDSHSSAQDYVPTSMANTNASTRTPKMARANAPTNSSIESTI